MILLRILWRATIASIGFLLAATAAGLTLLVGALDLGWNAVLAGEPEHVASAAIAGTIAVLAAATFAFAPAAVLVLLAEMFAWRALLLYVLAGGAIGAGVAPFFDSFDAPSLVLLAAAGFVGGFVYWLVAGRRAGLART